MLRLSRLFHQPERANKLVYLIPQSHVHDGNPFRMGYSKNKTFQYYDEYAHKVHQRLRQDGVKPEECIIFVDSVPTDVDQELFRQAVFREFPRSMPHDLLSTLIRALLKEGAQISGVEDMALLNSSANSQEGADKRDLYSRQYILDSLGTGQVGLWVIGVDHNLNALREFFTDHAVDVQSTELEYSRFKDETNVRNLFGDSSGRTR